MASHSQSPIDDLKDESALKAKDPKTRRILFAVVVLWLLTLAGLLVIAWSAYFSEKAKTQTLAQQIAHACEFKTFGPEFDEDDQTRLCENADKVIEDRDIPDGVPGPQGERGPQGLTGLQGVPGINGVDGVDGKKGPVGFSGTDGLDGRNGSNGTSGEDGTNGDDGANGTDGVNGEDGLSGANGAPGDPGQNGVDGKDGANGQDGAQGPPGPQGEIGPQGPVGPQGVTSVSTSGCEGPIVRNLSATYDASTQTVVITCNS